MSVRVMMRRARERVRRRGVRVGGWEAWRYRTRKPGGDEVLRVTGQREEG